MVVDRAKLSSSEPTLGARDAPGTPLPAGCVHAYLIGTNEDTKLLLRGLLRLYHHRVVFEGRSVGELEGVLPAPDPRVLVLDGETVPEGWESAIRAAQGAQPGLHTVLITSDRSPGLAARVRAAGASVVLVRPFAIAEFNRALAAASTAP